MKVDGIGSAMEGLLRAKDKINSAAGRIARDGGTVEDFVDTKEASRDFEANVKVIKTLSELEDRLLDIVT